MILSNHLYFSSRLEFLPFNPTDADKIFSTCSIVTIHESSISRFITDYGWNKPVYQIESSFICILRSTTTILYDSSLRVLYVDKSYEK